MRKMRSSGRLPLLVLLFVFNLVSRGQSAPPTTTPVPPASSPPTTTPTTSIASIKPPSPTTSTPTTSIASTKPPSPPTTTPTIPIASTKPSPPTTTIASTFITSTPSSLPRPVTASASPQTTTTTSTTGSSTTTTTASTMTPTASTTTTASSTQNPNMSVTGKATVFINPLALLFQRLNPSLDFNNSTAVQESLLIMGMAAADFVAKVEESYQSILAQLSPRCVKDLGLFQSSLSRGENWAIKMLDAGGKPKAGITKGQTVLVGDYDECVAIQPNTSGEHIAGAHYCKLEVHNDFPPPLDALLAKITMHLCLPSSCNDTDVFGIFHRVVDGVAGSSSNLTSARCIHARDPADDSSFWAAIAVLSSLAIMCVIGTLVGEIVDRREKKAQRKEDEKEAATSRPHVNAAFDDEHSNAGPVAMELRTVMTSPNWKLTSPGDSYSVPNGNEVAVATSLNARTSLKSMTSSNGEVPESKFVRRSSRKSSRKGHASAIGLGDEKKIVQIGVCTRLLLSFSVLKNGAKILNCDQNQGDLSCLHGIRVLSITWVILGHAFSMFDDTLGNKTDTFRLIGTRWTVAPLVSGTLSVDTFFLLSHQWCSDYLRIPQTNETGRGALTAYVFLRQTKRAGGVRCGAMVLYYVHRFWRLTPLYMVAVMFYLCVTPYLAVGPFDETPEGLTNCKTYWWHNLLYINNLVDQKFMCMGWSWYLSIDMQFYTIAPLVLVPWALGKKTLGVVVCFLLLLTHIICAAVFNYQVEGMLYLRNLDDYLQKVYYPPWCRVGPFAVGLVLGYSLYTTKCRYKMDKLSVVLGWLVAAVLGMTIVYIPYDDVHTLWPLSAVMTPSWTNTQASVYEALSRPGWALAVSWVIFACCTGYGGFVNTLLSWKAWIPLSRLTYGAYLFHLMVIYVFLRNGTDTYYLSEYNVVQLFLSSTVLSFMVAYVFSVLVESPTLGVEKILLGGRGGGAPRKKA